MALDALVDGCLRISEAAIVLMGWGMGAGLIIEAAHLVPKVGGLISINGFYNGKRAQKLVRGHDGCIRFLLQVNRARNDAVHSGKVEIMTTACPAVEKSWPTFIRPS